MLRHNKSAVYYCLMVYITIAWTFHVGWNIRSTPW